jgi:hypothetical protein
MNMPAFTLQMDRLRDRFGDRAYPNSLVGLVWKEVNQFSDRWFECAVDRMIGDARYAPLMPDFREAVAKERERLNDQQKRQHTADSKAFWDGTYHNEEVATICQTIKRRLKHECPDDEWEGFMRSIQARGVSG